ncbi:MAG: dihydrolipoyl dehydrogenase [Ignavibacteriales bacterium]|nr:MAG: dihydrolipoyl dehydrogenase [Ignavibacteriales bacterium]
MSKSFEIAILGGGPGGYVAAIRAAQLGYKTVIIEKDKLGGVCLNWGCIPTKSLLKSAELLEEIKHSKDYGLEVENVSFDFKKVIMRSRDISGRISKNVEFLMKKNKIEVIKGFGKLSGNNKIDVLDDNGKIIDSIETEKIIISTGARSRTIPQIPVDRKKVITSTEAMNLSEQPNEMVIVGAGAIGVEFAYFYNALGTKVTLIEMMDNILPIEDKEVSETLEKILKKKGIVIHTKATVDNVKAADDKVEVNVTINGESKIISSDIVLNAIGIVGNVEGFGLEELGVELYKNHIKVDKHSYQTNIKNIYAIGDVIGPPWLAHVASAEGIHCVETLNGLNPSEVDYTTIPGCTYCQPQVASVGLTEQRAKEEGYEIKVGKFPFTASGKAFATGERDGFVKVIFDAKYGELLGAHVIGANATELIAEFTLAKSMEATFESIIKTVHAHPTLSESVMEAVANAYNEAIHI